MNGREDINLQCIFNAKGRELSFYFETWFSFATQHGENAIVFDP